MVAVISGDSDDAFNDLILINLHLQQSKRQTNPNTENAGNKAWTAERNECYRLLESQRFVSLFG